MYFPASPSSLIPPSPPPTKPWACLGRVSDFFIIIALHHAKLGAILIIWLNKYIRHTGFLFWGYNADFQNRLASGDMLERYTYSSRTQWKFGIWILLKFLLCIGLYCLISKIKLTQWQSLSKALFFLENSFHCFPHSQHCQPLKEGWISRTHQWFLHDELTGQPEAKSEGLS